MRPPEIPPPDLAATLSPGSGSPSFRAVPWSWVDVLIGLAPLVAAQSSLVLLSPAVLGSASRRLWVPATAVAMAWMLSYPLWIARRRVGMPPLPRPRAVLVEASLALLAVPALMVLVTVLTQALVGLFGDAAEPGSPLEPIAGSTDRVQWLGLVILAGLAAPPIEEIFFRGMLYNALRRRLHMVLAAPLQAVVFSLFHPFGLADRAVILLIGIVLAVFYEWRKTLLAPMLLHFMINTVSMAVMFATIAHFANAPVLGVGAEPNERGCLVANVVPGGTAEASGLQSGDVITALDEYPVPDRRTLVEVLRSKRVGDKVPLDYLRGGKAFRVEAVLKARPKD